MYGFPFPSMGEGIFLVFCYVGLCIVLHVVLACACIWFSICFDVIAHIYKYLISWDYGWCCMSNGVLLCMVLNLIR